MTPTERGKFCAHCQKDVIDFSTKTDTEIANFVKNNKGNFCGRFVNTQLDKEFSYIEQEKYSNLKYAAALALGVLVTENSQAQNENSKSNIIQIDNKQIETTKQAKNDSTTEKTKYISVSGFILDGETNEPIPYASIYESLTNRGAITDKNVFFVFPAKIPSKLIIKSLGYETSFIDVLDSSKSNSNLKIQLVRKYDEITMGITIKQLPSEKIMFTEPVKVKKK
ncbi:MAG: carboxypeptidase-like regulatory domain-containing protein, partial [Chitinophagales bacterium]|nr:carboxypeptidase-like regulatory domain-containing protein [Chitinophagales bacterium]